MCSLKNRQKELDSAVSAALSVLFPLTCLVFLVVYCWMRWILPIIADPRIIQVTLNCPRTGNLPPGKGCLICRTGASIAALRFYPSSKWIRLCLRRWATFAWARVNRKCHLGSRLLGFTEQAAEKGQPWQASSAKWATKLLSWLLLLTFTLCPLGQVIWVGFLASVYLISKSDKYSFSAQGFQPRMAVWIYSTSFSRNASSVSGPP